MYRHQKFSTHMQKLCFGNQSTTNKVQFIARTDRSWSCLHIDFARPLNGSYYLIVVDSFSKGPEILRCKKLIMRVVIGFLHELFIRFRVPVSDNATQLTSKEFKGFCKIFVVEHITITPYHQKSNSQAEWFVDTFKGP